MTLSLIVTFILILLVTVFGLQNGMPLNVKFLFWNLHTSLITVIFGSSLIGAAIIAILTLPKLVTKHLNEKRLTKKLNSITQQNGKGTKPPSPQTNRE